MHTLRIRPSTLQGTLNIPPSKSHTMRALLFGSMAKGQTHIHNFLKSPDTEAMIRALSSFGVRIDTQENALTLHGVEGKLSPSDNVIDAGNSGQVLRFIGSLSALLPSYTVITGDASIRTQRPIRPLLSALNQLNAFAVSAGLNDKAPLIVRGPMEPKSATFSGEDSQPVSGILMAAAFLNGTTLLNVTNPKEKPWIDLTLSWLRRFGARVENENYEKYQIKGPLSYEGFEFNVPGDFSSAAFPLVASVITRSSLTLENVDMADVQGDKKIVEILTEMGGNFQYDAQKKTLKILPTDMLKGICVDADGIIDAVPILAVCGCFAQGKTEIFNAKIARQKESDRLSTITSELRKMGARIEEKEDRLTIWHSPLKGASLNSHQDHRIAMALSVASLAARGNSLVNGIECIAKSFPSFISDFQKTGAHFE